MPSRRAPGIKRLIVLGSTGSIGTQTLDVVAHLNTLHARGLSPVGFEVVGLAAGRNAAMVLDQAQAFGVRELALADAPAEFGRAGRQNVRVGPDGAERLVREVECDVVLAAMVGAAGLPATLAAVELGRDVALANKETLVAAGAIVVPAAVRSGSKLLPVDSEHSAVWQCLGACAHGRSGASPAPPVPPVDCGAEIARVVLTASGGPFRTWSAEATRSATPEQALNHPTWSMGPKVTVDSASLTNKALEVIEAHWLFGLPCEKIDVLVHPQSIVHALVEFADGSVLAQMGPPDMRTPIQCALTHPHRPDGRSRRIDWGTLGKLEFSPPDHERFPALGLGYEVIRRGGTAGAVFNGANEAAVAAFLDRRIPFGRIAELSRQALHEVGSSPLRTLADAMEADAEARRFVARSLQA